MTCNVVPETFPFQFSPGAPEIQGSPVLPPAHERWRGPLRLAGQQDRLVHGGVHCWWSWLDGGHRWRRGTEGVGSGSLRLGGGRAGRAGQAHSLWISTRKATLVLPAALWAVQL